LAICLLLIIAFDCILCLLLQLLVSHFYLHDLCVFFVCVLYIFYVYMGLVPEIKLMMMMNNVNLDAVAKCVNFAEVQFFKTYT